MYTNIMTFKTGKLCKKKLICKKKCGRCFQRSYAFQMFMEEGHKWDYSKNKGVNPRNVNNHSDEKYHFICRNCKHPLYLSLKSAKKNKCSHCNNNVICNDYGCEDCFHKSYAFQIVTEKGNKWDYTKNNGVNPRSVKNTLQKQKYHFICRICNHPITTTPLQASLSSCIYCNSGELCERDDCDICFEKSYASAPIGSLVSCDKHITPRQIKKCGSKNGEYLFRCTKCKHAFETRPESAVLGRCIYCSKRKLCGDINCEFCLQKSFGSLEQPILDQWIDVLNPRDVNRKDKIFIDFHCNKCNTPFKVKAYYLNLGRWCPNCCAGSGFCKEDCEDCSKLSMSGNSILEWDEEKNRRKASSVKKYSSKKWHFTCTNCKHPVFTKNRSNLLACMYCHKKILCDDSDCIICEKKSYKNALYTSHELIEIGIDPRDIYITSHRKYLFKCKICKHQFETSASSAYNGECSFCGLSKLCDDSDCKVCNEKSLVSFDENKLKYWSSKNELTPRDYSMHSNQYIFIDCHKCNKIFEIMINSFTNGAWCPCSRRFSTRVTELCLFLDNKHIEYKQEYTIKYYERIYYLDFIVKPVFCNPFFVEYDGQQHFNVESMMGVSRQSEFSKGVELFNSQRKRDLIKDEYIKNNNELLFRFSYRNKKSISELVTEMFKINESGVKGVVILDDIEEYWTT